MKKAFIFILVLHTILAKAQKYELFDKTNNYQFIKPGYIHEKGISPMIEILAEQNSKFTILKDSGNEYEIIFYLWKAKQSINAKKFNFIDSTFIGEELESINNRKIFIISKGSFNECCLPYWNVGVDWTAGFVLLPLKFRNYPKFTYSKDITLGFSAGSKFRISHNNPTFINVLYSIGISSSTLDANSTGGLVKDPSNRATMTNSFGLVLENHAYQFGIFIGRDRLSSNDFENTKWIYNRKNWISIGLGYQIFTKENTKKQGEVKN